MQTTLLGLGIILAIATWHFVWRPTVLDHARDALFDLRDGTVREYFVTRGIRLDHPTYVALRELINGHLRHTESLTLYRFIGMSVWTVQNPEAAAAFGQWVEKRFQTDDHQLRELIQNVRRRATEVMFAYMAESSLVGWMLTLIGVMASLMWAGCKSLASKVASQVEEVKSVPFARVAAGLLTITTLLGVARPSDAQTMMEECALVKPA